MRAFIIVDIQNDFTTGGALEVSQGETIIPLVNELQSRFDLVVATQDWHPSSHKSFASNHEGKKPFEKTILQGMDQVLWPDHCVQATKGADFHPALDMKRVEAIFRKGMDVNIDSYSGFYDNGHLRSTGMSGYLRERGVTEVYVCGLAGDYCVYFTAKDALREGFETFLIEDATRSINLTGFEVAKKDLIAIGGNVVEARMVSSF
jgi:nicotinamidase/pyrazinamidase